MYLTSAVADAEEDLVKLFQGGPLALGFDLIPFGFLLIIGHWACRACVFSCLDVWFFILLSQKMLQDWGLHALDECFLQVWDGCSYLFHEQLGLVDKLHKLEGRVAHICVLVLKILSRFDLSMLHSFLLLFFVLFQLLEQSQLLMLGNSLVAGKPALVEVCGASVF